MLRLEKKTYGREIYITIREKNSFWNPTLLQAFCCALILHVLALVIFRVPPFSSKESTFVFPPALVNIDLEKETDDTIAMADLESEKKYSWLHPIFNETQCIEMPLSQTIRQLEYKKEPNLIENPFPSKVFPFSDEMLSTSPLQTNFTLRIRNAAGLHLVDDHFEIDSVNLNLSEAGLYCYQIYVDSHTGLPVGWQLESAYPSEKKEIEELVQKILPQLKFITSQKNGFILQAVLELSTIPGSHKKVRCRCD